MGHGRRAIPALAETSFATSIAPHLCRSHDRSPATYLFCRAVYRPAGQADDPDRTLLRRRQNQALLDMYQRAFPQVSDRGWDVLRFLPRGTALPGRRFEPGPGSAIRAGSNLNATDGQMEDAPADLGPGYDTRDNPASHVHLCDRLATARPTIPLRTQAIRRPLLSRAAEGRETATSSTRSGRSRGHCRPGCPSVTAAPPHRGSPARHQNLPGHRLRLPPA